MKSDERINAEDKYKKATNVLWKIWWFFVFLFIIPSVITFLSFIIINFIANQVEIFAGPDIYVVIGLSVIIYIFSGLFFYRFFDRYRENSMFLKQKNNPTARIHILFLITLSSFIVTPIFIVITPPEYQFELLPLIAFCLLYTIVWYYFSLKPIDYYNQKEEQFNRALKASLSLKQPHNYLIIFNYFIQILYLSLIFQTKISWAFALFTNLLFYIITLSGTNGVRKNISEKIKSRSAVTDDLITFKYKFNTILLSLNFILILQIPFVIMSVNMLQGLNYTIMDFINSTIFAVLIFFLYLKFRIYIVINYKKIGLGVM